MTLPTKFLKSTAFIFVSFAVVAAPVQVALADENTLTEEEQKYDGSEYNGSTFKDSSFEKKDYKDIPGVNTSGAVKGLRAVMSKKGAGEGDVKAIGERKESKGDNLASGEAERVGPVYDLPGDWVPDAINLTSNGGFTNAPFNGSPVPYTLNGWVNIERDRP